MALYGKEIGNVILDDMESNPVNYRGRNIVYASDVSEATQRLLNRQASELDTKSAHELTPISHKDMDNICKILFAKKELDTILKLIQRQ